MEKLKRYIEEKGLKKNKFAERLGMSPILLNRILKGSDPIPKKYWRKIVKETYGEITLTDILEDFLKDVVEE